jgi:hypothetical protein
MLQIVKDTFRLLTFRLTREEFLSFGRGYLIFGLICTWFVGVGRYWDNPEAEFLQHLGVGSVVYIFVLALFLWIFIAPLQVKNWSYQRFLTFIALVSPPAILYAIPIEKFTDLSTANGINAWFLFIVAAWRVALLLFALRVFFELDRLAAVTTTFFPLSLIVIGLGVLNADKFVFNVMGGIREPSPNDSAYGVLLLLFVLSIFLAPLLLLTYFALIIRGSRKPTSILSIKDDSDD